MLKNRILSLDIFDTCLSRSSSLPSSVFYIMAIKCLKTKHRQELYEFVNARIRAERKAVTLASKEHRDDATLEEIYRAFNLTVPGFSHEELMQLELETESLVLKPIHATYTLLLKARQEGKRVIFVTDNYLPREFIQQQLEKHGFFQDGDGLYVSGEIGLTKASGRLYEYVREKEVVTFSQIDHYGDNEITDYYNAKQKGINAVLIDTGLNRYEFAWNNNAYAAGYPLETYMISGISRSIRLSQPCDTHTTLVLSAIAPLFVPFVSWMLRDARKRNISKLYFLARDGFILFEIAKVLGVNFPDIEVKYLYGSRRAFYTPGLKDLSEDEFRWALSGGNRKTPRQMLLRLNIEVETVIDAMHAMALPDKFLDDQLNKDSLEVFLDVLTHQSTRQNFTELILEQKKLVQDYFIQEGLMGDKKCAVVDIGWSRFCHRSINAIMEPSRVFGYFLGVLDNRVSVSDAGEFVSAFYPEEFFQEDCNKNLLKHEFLLILEQFFALNGQQSTVGFKRVGDTIQPVFEVKKKEENNFSGYPELHVSLVRKFAEEYLKYDEFIFEPGHLMRTCGYSSIITLVNNPTREEAKIFADFLVDTGVEDSVPLITKLGIFKIIRFVAEALKGHKRAQEFVWTEGTMVYSIGYAGLRILKVGRKFKEYFRKGRHKKTLTQI